MEIDYSKLIRKATWSIIWAVIYIIFAIIIFNTSKNLTTFWKFFLLAVLIYNLITIISKSIDILGYKDLERSDRSQKKKSKKKSSYWDNGFSSNYEKSYQEAKANSQKQRKYSSYDDYFEYTKAEYEAKFKKMYEEYEKSKNAKSSSGRSTSGSSSGRSSNNGRSTNGSGNNNYQRFKQARIKSQSEKLDDAYKLMGLKSSDDVQVIKSEYRKLAIKWHPDKWSLDTDENQKIANRNFQKLSAAYELIKKDRNMV